MRTLLFVLAAVAVAAIAGEPSFPRDAVCSIKAEGTASMNVGMQVTGTAVMKRVRDSLRIDVEISMVAKFSVIARGDKDETKVDVTESAMPAQIPTGCASAGAIFDLNGYTYSESVEFNGVRANKFTHSSGKAIMYFSMGNGKLLGEEFTVALNNMQVTLNVTYNQDTVLPYERTDAADNAFNSDACKFTGDDEYSLTAKCAEGPHSTSSTTPEPSESSESPSSSSETGAAGVIVPSLALLLTAAVLLL